MLCKVVRASLCALVVRLVVRWLCVLGCAQLCAQRRMVVRGVVHKLVCKGCAQTVCTVDAKSCAPQTAQGFCLVLKSIFRGTQGCEPCACFI